MSMPMSVPSVAPADPAVAALREAARRSARGGARRAVLALHLATIDSLRPHHARVARAILTDIARRLEGEVLRLPTGDLALICPLHTPAADRIGPYAPGPSGLAGVLERLFGATVPELYSRWCLPDEEPSLQLWLDRLPASSPAPAASVAPDLPQASTAPLPPIHRQTAIRIDPTGTSHRVLPGFEEITVANTPAHPGADPFLLRHLAQQHDQRLIAAVAQCLAAGPPDPARLPLHLNLTLPALLSDDLPALAACSRPIGVELSLLDACADPAAYAAARTRLSALGIALILDEVTADSLAVTRPAGLGASAIKLAWSPQLARTSLAGSLDGAPRDQIILYRAETEAALAWGLARGIRRFQGRQVDAMLAAMNATARPAPPNHHLIGLQ
jgi:hypothetical protein